MEYKICCLSENSNLTGTLAFLFFNLATLHLNQDQKIVRKPYIGSRGIDFKIKEPASAKSYGRNYQNCSRSSRKVSGLSEIEEGVNGWLCWRQRQKLDHMSK